MTLIMRKVYRRKGILMAPSLTAITIAMAYMAAGDAYAQSTPPAVPAPATQSSGASKTAESVTPEDILQEIVVTGRKTEIGGGYMIAQREPVTTNSISAEAISEKMGIAGPYQLIASLPGVDTGQSDPYQLSIRYGLFIRGLPVTDIGWTVDGAPSLDQAYLLPYSETWADNENLAGVTVLPGSTRIADPVQTAVAGEFIETIRDPSDNPGANVSYSYGSYDAQRTFAGIDTGLIGNTGIKALASASYTQAGTFALPSDAIGHRTHADFKVEKDWGDIGKSTIFVSDNDWDAVRSNPYSLKQFKTDQQTGNYSVGNYAYTFNPAGPSNTYWKEAVYTRQNILIVWHNEINVTSRFQVDVIPYYHSTYSNSPGGSTLNPSSAYAGNQIEAVSTAGLFLFPNGNIPVKTSTLQNEADEGLNTYAKYDVTPNNQFQLGWWYDHWSMTELNDSSPVSSAGYAPNWANGALYSTTGQVISGADFVAATDINAFSIQDSQSFLNNKLRFEVGVKYFVEDLTGDNLLPGPQTYFSRENSLVLPRGTVSYDINSNSQVYADVITGTRPPVPITTYPNTYSTSTGKLSQTANPFAEPEKSVGEELGYRYHDDVWVADLAVFNKRLTNHSIVSQAFLNGAGINTALNAGSVLLQGATVEFALRPVYGFSPYINGQYLHDVTESNFQVVGYDYLPTKGKIGVEAPEFTATAGVSYKQGPFFGNVLIKYTDSQYSTLMDDQAMPAYTTIDAGIGFHVPAGFLGKDPIIRVDFTNLRNKPYLGTISGISTNSLPTTGIHGIMIPGTAPAGYDLSSPMAVMATLSTAF